MSTAAGAVPSVTGTAPGRLLPAPSMLTALFGIDDGSLNLAVNLLILVLVVVWLALVYWTYADARRRIEDPVLIATATAAALFPYVGTVVYTILRPPEFLEDRHEREVETRASELRLRRLTETSCPRCEHPIELSWLRCPECRHRLKDPCRGCGRPVDPRWAVCPYCESPVAAEGTRGRRAPRRAPSSKASAPPPQAAAARRSAAERRAAERRGEQQAASRRSGAEAAPARPVDGEPRQGREGVERASRRKPESAPSPSRGNG